MTVEDGLRGRWTGGRPLLLLLPPCCVSERRPDDGRAGALMVVTRHSRAGPGRVPCDGPSPVTRRRSDAGTGRAGYTTVETPVPCRQRRQQRSERTRERT